MKVNAFGLYHLKVIMHVVSLGSSPSHTLGPEKYVQHQMAFVYETAQMVQDYPMLTIFYLYQHLLHVSFPCLINVLCIKYFITNHYVELCTWLVNICKIFRCSYIENCDVALLNNYVSCMYMYKVLLNTMQSICSTFDSGILVAIY